MFLTPDYITATLRHIFGSADAFAPELLTAGGVVLLLVLRLVPALDRLNLGVVALAVVLLALGVSWIQWNSDVRPHTAFNGMLAYDGLTVFLRLFLLGFAALVIWLSLLTGIPDREDSADFFALLLGATLGMMLMASANHLLMVYLAVEMASLPSYALAGFLKGRRASSEAALKYVVYGGAAAGVMLFGISLLAGRFGTGYLPEVAASFTVVLRNAVQLQQSSFDPVLVIGLLMIIVGLGFKLAAVPFHFWCPDVFEGAAAEVAAFLSVASKGAAIALVGRFSLTMVGIGWGGPPVADDGWRLVTPYLGPALAFLAAITATFGNLAAYAQTNLKRLLAYSTIAHAGYMLMALAPLTRTGLDAALFYMAAYLVMNLGAFAVVAFIRNRTGTEDLSGYAGLGQRAPLLTAALAVFLLSLVGLPPLIGYMAKFQIFATLYDAAVSLDNGGLLVLLVIGLLNTVLSLFYYVRVLKVMILDAPPAGADPAPVRVPPLQGLYTVLLAAVAVVGIFFWDPLAEASRRGAEPFRQVEVQPAPPAVAAAPPNP